MHALILDLRALILGFHRAQDAAARVDAVELGENGLLDFVGQPLDEVAALGRVLVLGHAVLAVDDELDRHAAAHALLGRRRDRLIVSVRVKRVGVLVHGEKRLERGADVVELDLLGVQGAAARLAMIFQLLGPLVRVIAVTHGDCPNAPRDAADDRVFWIHAVAEEERQVRREVVDLHAAAQIILYERKAVRQGERELRNRVRAGLGDMIAGDAYRIIVPDFVSDEKLLDVAEHLEREVDRKNAGVLRLVFLQNVGLDRSTNGLQRVGADPGGFFRGQGRAFRRFGLRDLLSDGVRHVEREHDRSRAVDGHADACVRIAQIEAREEVAHVLDRGDADAAFADLAEHVGTFLRVLAVKGDAVERRRQALGRIVRGQEVEPFVGALRPAFSGELTLGVLIGASEREDAGSEGERARHIFFAHELHERRVIFGVGNRDARNLKPRERNRVRRHLEGLPANRVAEHVAPVIRRRLGPGQQCALHAGGEFAPRLVALPAQLLAGLFTAHEAESCFAGMRLFRGERLALGLLVIGADGVGDLGQIVRAALRNNWRYIACAARAFQVDQGFPGIDPATSVQHGLEFAIQAVRAVVVPGARHGAEHRHRFGLDVSALVPGAAELAADIAPGVLGAAPVELVDRDQVGEIEHVDLLELHGSAELAGHHIQRHVGDSQDTSVALADAARLDDDQIEACGAGEADRVGDGVGQLASALAGGETAHEHVRVIDRVHADTVAEQGSAGFFLRRIDAEHAVPAVGILEPEAPDQLVGETALAGAARPRDAENQRRLAQVVRAGALESSRAAPLLELFQDHLR
ncbi:MAG: hypothetical protein BWY66_02864 [bacterium ADurb.Bin374]|nr:MAG: hypothetical protein BWY66_02864 [bacterium ADurb.Bin374]